MTRVLFISHSKRGEHYYNDASARYRCIFPAEHLNDIGINAHVIHFQQLKKINPSEYSHVVFHRPQYSLKLKRTLNSLKRLNVKAICDFDDLLFTPKLAAASAAVKSGHMSIKLANKQATSYLKALWLFSDCWASTIPLAQELKNSHPASNITICYNRVSHRWSQLTLPTDPIKRLKNKVIRYLPGTSHHKHDFAKIQKWLAQLLHEHSDIKLEIVGDLAFSNELFPINQLSQQKFVNYESLPDLISQSWLTLAPLEENIFNQCKSALKFWESGLFKVPVISSPLPDMGRFKNSGLCLNKNLNHWKTFILQMKCKEAYLNACQEAYASATEALFSSEIPDARLTTLGLREPLPAIPAPPEVHFYNQHLYMSAQFGPRWPATVLNPTEKSHKEANHFLSSIKDKNLTGDLEKKLKKDMLERIEQDTPKKRSAFVRKAKKLWNSPQIFFKDIKVIQ